MVFGGRSFSSDIRKPLKMGALAPEDKKTNLPDYL